MRDITRILQSHVIGKDSYKGWSRGKNYVRNNNWIGLFLFVNLILFFTLMAHELIAGKFQSIQEVYLMADRSTPVVFF